MNASNEQIESRRVKSEVMFWLGILGVFLCTILQAWDLRCPIGIMTVCLFVNARRIQAEISSMPAHGSP